MFYLLVGAVFVCAPKTSCPSALRRPPRAPQWLRRGQQAGSMSTRGGRALEPSSPAPWLSRTARRRSEQTSEVDAVTVIDGSTACFQGTARARRCLFSKPESAGFEIPFTLAHYNYSYGGVDRLDVLVVPQEQMLPEDVLR